MFDKSWTGLFKHASEMQSKLAEIQEGLAEKTIEVSTGGGMVTVSYTHLPLPTSDLV